MTWLELAAVALGSLALAAHIPGIICIIILFRRSKKMDLIESLQNAVKFNTDAVQTLSDTVDKMPAQITTLVQKTIADYVAANPGTDGSVPDAVIMEAVQTIVSDAKRMLANESAVGAFLENQIVHGDPFWTGDPNAA